MMFHKRHAICNTVAETVRWGALFFWADGNVLAAASNGAIDCIRTSATQFAGVPPDSQRLSGEGLWYVLHVEELPMYQCVVWVEPKKFNLVIWDFGSSASDSCFFLFPMNYFPLSFLLSLTPFFFSSSFWLQGKVLVWLSFPLLNGGCVRIAFQCSDARHASGTAVAETIRRVCGEASIRTSLEKTIPWLI